MTVDELRRRLDVGLSSRPRVALDRSDLVSAAVLVPILDRGEPRLLFTQKSQSVPHHKGQFSFPGGICEERDASRVETALREAWEEIQMPGDDVEVLGLLDDTATRATPFIITPVVGLVREPGVYRPDGREIARIVEVPLARLRDPAIFRTETWQRNGEDHEVHFFDVGPPEDVIWGATARILRQFLDLVEASEPPRP